jgi:cytochrome P450
VSAVDQVTVGGEVPAAGEQAFDALHAAMAASIDSSPLLRAVESDGSLTTTEVVGNVAVLLFGGIVTAGNTAAAVLSFLLGHPGALAEVRDDGSLVANAVEEVLRLEPAAAVVDRYATRPVDLGGAEIRQGDLMRVSLAGAGRDPAVFPEPDRFDLHRRNASQHLAFAVGPHACLGIHLARLEATAAVTAAVAGLSRLRAGAEWVEPVAGLIFRAPATVHAEWETG